MSLLNIGVVMKKALFFIFCLICAGIFNLSAVNAEQVKDEQYYLNLGKDYEWKNNRLGAIDLYTKALEVNPDFDEARSQRARLLYFEGKYDKALEDFTYFYNKQPEYGAGVYYEYRIDCKKKLGMTEAAIDDMYEVILAYGGQAKVLQDMIDLIQENPEYKYKLSVDAHMDLIAKYKTQAKALKDYAQTFLDKQYNIVNKDYYNFFITISNTMYDMIAQENDPDVKPVLRRTAPGEAEQVINVEQN